MLPLTPPCWLLLWGHFGLTPQTFRWWQCVSSRGVSVLMRVLFSCWRQDPSFVVDVRWDGGFLQTALALLTGFSSWFFLPLFDHLLFCGLCCSALVLERPCGGHGGMFQF